MWVVERMNSWHNNRFRKLLVRYEKKSNNYLGLVHFACCIIVYTGEQFCDRLLICNWNFGITIKFN
jgi:hypothetical protein